MPRGAEDQRLRLHEQDEVDLNHSRINYPGGGDWYWAQYKPSGKIDQDGKVDECIKCHEAQKTNDYVYTSKMK